MPREAQPPRAMARPNSVMSPQKGPMKIPLNDDKQEKSVRFKSRQALQEIQMNSIRAAATPAKRRVSQNYQESPRTPEDKENEGSPAVNVIPGDAVTPMKRMPILANFEEWMKMATDNKINATNSWNFALIDYFHDMSLLREGDSVNFQKASCTLDGCVKIYTNRVDSVATETGKLLSGLADSGDKKRKGETQDSTGEDQDDDEEGEEGPRKRGKKKRSAESTLAPSFESLQLKKMELEFSVDPLFKKASADFDEGGAKGLLLNHLTTDSHGRIVFDSSDDTEEAEQKPETQEGSGDNEAADQDAPQNASGEIDMGYLAQRFFPDLNILDSQDICPSLKTYELEGDAESMNIPFLKAPDDWRDRNSTQNPDPNTNQASLEDGQGVMPSFGDDADAEDICGFEMAYDVGFGEGGEAWARDAALDSQTRPHDIGSSENAVGDEGDEVDAYNVNSSKYGVAIARGRDNHENILNYFDQALQKNWAGPEHWRIQKIKDANKQATPAPKRKEKEPFEIDFRAPMSRVMADLIYTPAATNSSITMPKSQWKSKTRNLLPDDKHFNSRQLLHLFLKPKARIGAKRSHRIEARNEASRDANAGDEMDKDWWARNQATQPATDPEEGQVKGDYDANFFQDDGFEGPVGVPDDDDEDFFADARENLSPGADDAQQPVAGSIDGILSGDGQPQNGFGTQLVTQSRRIRPEYVQYARVAKKVDVRRLKEELWKGMGFEDPKSVIEPQQEASPPEQEKQTPGTVASMQEGESLQFTSLMNNLQSVYPTQAMADISTSYCFICLLHLANEKGLKLENQANFEDIRITKDTTARITEIGD